MTNPMTDERRAAFEAWYRRRFTFYGKCYMDVATFEPSIDGGYKERVNEAWLGWQAALSYHGEVVKVSDVQKVIDRWDNGQYGPGQVVEALRNLTALISKAEKV